MHVNIATVMQALQQDDRREGHSKSTISHEMKVLLKGTAAKMGML